MTEFLTTVTTFLLPWQVRNTAMAVWAALPSGIKKEHSSCDNNSAPGSKTVFLAHHTSVVAVCSAVVIFFYRPDAHHVAQHRNKRKTNHYFRFLFHRPRFPKSLQSRPENHCSGTFYRPERLAAAKPTASKHWRSIKALKVKSPKINYKINAINQLTVTHKYPMKASVKKNIS